MNQKSKILIISVLVIIIIILFLPIQYPVSIESMGKLLPYKSWVIVKDAAGRLETSLSDNLSGFQNGFTVSEFENGDAIQFKLNINSIKNNFVEEGDTIGLINSNEIEKNIEQLKSELVDAKAYLTIQLSSEKESVIEEEKNRLRYAEKELEEQEIVFNRKTKLMERNLISQQEYDTDKARYELAKINISIAKERLNTVQSGSKVELVNQTKTKISALENEIRVLRKRQASNNIISPISGFIERSFSSDTLLIVNDISNSIVIIPIELSRVNEIELKQNVMISSKDSDEKIIGEVVSIGNTVNTSGSLQYVFVTVCSYDKIEELRPGQYVECKMDCGDVSATNLIADFFQPIIK